MGLSWSCKETERVRDLATGAHKTARKPDTPPRFMLLLAQASAPLRAARYSSKMGGAYFPFMVSLTAGLCGKDHPSSSPRGFLNPESS